MIAEAISQFLKGGVPAIAGLVIAFFALWVKRVNDQKRRNTMNEIDLAAKKIDFRNHTDPLDQLVADSNKSHAAGPVVKDPGNSGETK